MFKTFPCFGVLLAACGALIPTTSIAQTAPDRVLRVGPDADCDFSTVEDAYAAVVADSSQPGNVEVRLMAVSFPDTQLQMDHLVDDHPDGFQIRFVGHYQDCASDNLSPLIATRLEGRVPEDGDFTGNQPPLFTMLAGRPRQPSDSPVLERRVIFEGITFGYNHRFGNGAGILMDAGSLELIDVKLTELTAIRGGAIFVRRAEDDLRWPRPEVRVERMQTSGILATGSDDLAAEGGAIFCEGGDITGSATMARGEAETTFSGMAAIGGFASLHDCSMDLTFEPRSPNNDVALGFSRAVAADGLARGAAFAAQDGSQLRLGGRFFARDLTVQGSFAQSGGGLLYASGPTTRVTIDALDAHAVNATGSSFARGGLVLAENGATVKIGCNDTFCNQSNARSSFLTDIHASGFGGLFAAFSDGSILLRNAVVHDSSASASGAVALVAGGSIEFDGVRFQQNHGGEGLFAITGIGDGDVILRHVTTLDNDVPAVLAIGSATIGEHVSVESSIFAEPSAALFNAAGYPAELHGCSIITGASGLPADPQDQLREVENGSALFDAQRSHPGRLGADSPARALSACPTLPRLLSHDMDRDPWASSGANPGSDQYAPRHRRACTRPTGPLILGDNVIPISINDPVNGSNLRVSMVLSNVGQGDSDILSFQLRRGTTELALADTPTALNSPIPDSDNVYLEIDDLGDLLTDDVASPLFERSLRSADPLFSLDGVRMDALPWELLARVSPQNIDSRPVILEACIEYLDASDPTGQRLFGSGFE